MLTNVEQWRSVLGYEQRYEVSDCGRVRSISRGILSQRIGRSGYLIVDLSAHDEKCRRKVHHLVLEAFVGPRPEGYVTCHANDVRTDNRLENLRWDTPSANIFDAVVNGCHPQAKKTVCRNDHEYTPANTYHRPDGGRGCRMCRNAAQQKYIARGRP